MAKKEEYNWIDDPFNDKRDKLDHGGPNKGLLGLGCIVVVILLIALVIFSLMAFANLSTSF